MSEIFLPRPPRRYLQAFTFIQQLQDSSGIIFQQYILILPLYLFIQRFNSDSLARSLLPIKINRRWRKEEGKKSGNVCFTSPTFADAINSHFVNTLKDLVYHFIFRLTTYTWDIRDQETTGDANQVIFKKYCEGFFLSKKLKLS